MLMGHFDGRLKTLYLIHDDDDAGALPQVGNSSKGYVPCGHGRHVNLRKMSPRDHAWIKHP